MDGFSERLRAAMASANIKAIELSEKTGINRSSISEYLAGSYEPKQVNIFKMAKALGVKPSYLMGVSVDSITSNECKAGASTKITIESGTQGYDLMQAYLRHPQRVQDEIVRRANIIDETFSNNVSRLLDASGDINGFKQETNLNNVVVGKLMIGESVQLTPEEAERVADYFKVDIVEMFFGEVDPLQEVEKVERLLEADIGLLPKESLTRELMLALKKYIEYEKNPSCEKLKAAIDLIHASTFDIWLHSAFGLMSANFMKTYKKDEILDAIAKEIYKSTTRLWEIYNQESGSDTAFADWIMGVVKKAKDSGQ